MALSPAIFLPRLQGIFGQLLLDFSYASVKFATLARAFRPIIYTGYSMSLTSSLLMFSFSMRWTDSLGLLSELFSIRQVQQKIRATLQVLVSQKKEEPPIESKDHGCPWQCPLFLLFFARVAWCVFVWGSPSSRSTHIRRNDRPAGGRALTSTTFTWQWDDRKSLNLVSPNVW